MKVYPKYKPSGIDSLSDIPSHWIFNYFKRFVFFQEGPGLRHWQFKENGIKVICVTNITENGIDFSSFTKYISEEEYLESYQHFTVKKGDLLLASSGASWGKVAEYESDEVVILNTSTIRLNSQKNKINRRFLRWLLSSNYINDQLSVLITGSCQPNFGPTHLSKLEIAIPESELDQQKIVNFLDYKTEQCDRFISNRQKQIELLNEQKASIINKAVTKGINPNAKMKPSGIDWIGDIPEHWEIQKLKYLCEHISIPAFSKKQDETYIALENIEGWTGKFIFNEEFSGFDSTARKFTDKDILFGKLRPYLAKVAIPDFKGVCVSEIIVLRPIKLLREFLYFMLLNADFIDFVSQTAEGTKMPRTSWNKIADLKFPLPSKEEQQAVLDFIKQETSKIEALISKYQKQIELMQEYRTALISQAVTGKIDVREWKPQTK